MRRRRFSVLHIISSLLFSAALAAAVDIAAAFFASPISFAAFAAVFGISSLLLIAFNISSKWTWLFFFVIAAAAGILLTAILWGYQKNSENSAGFEPGSGSISIVDMKGNVVKNHIIDEKGSEQFRIKTRGFEVDLTVSTDNPRCIAKYENGIITLKCPKEESCTLTVSSLDGQHFAHAIISNPGRFMRETGPYFNELLQQFKTENLHQSNTYFFIKGFVG